MARWSRAPGGRASTPVIAVGAWSGSSHAEGSAASVGAAGSGGLYNAIAPAQITNPAFEVRMDNTPGLRETFMRGIPAGRLGVPDDIKGMVMFLASDASAFVSGMVMPLEGGLLPGGRIPFPLQFLPGGHPGF